MSSRPYRSARRTTTAARTRQRIVTAAAAFLGAPAGIGGFSLTAVAKKAGVTRLTVYNQFGSRRALLEAVFDERAARGGLHRIEAAMADPNPHAALNRVVDIFCDFWSVDPGALWRLHAAGAIDSKFEASVRARNERRRQVFSALINRLAPGERLGAQTRADLIDVLFALTSFPFFSQLTSGGRTKDAARCLIQALAADALRRTLADST